MCNGGKKDVIINNDCNINSKAIGTAAEGKHAADFLNGFTGYLACDGFDSYNAVTGTKRCGYWTHLRRRFVEALPRDKSAHKMSVAAQANGLDDEKGFTELFLSRPALLFFRGMTNIK